MNYLSRAAVIFIGILAFTIAVLAANYSVKYTGGQHVAVMVDSTIDSTVTSGYVAIGPTLGHDRMVATATIRVIYKGTDTVLYRGDSLLLRIVGTRNNVPYIIASDSCAVCSTLTLTKVYNDAAGDTGVALYEDLRLFYYVYDTVGGDTVFHGDSVKADLEYNALLVKD